MTVEPYWQDELTTLYCADSIEHPELWTDADILVTDPPYGMRYKSGRTARGDKIIGDDNTQCRDRMLDEWNANGEDRPALVFGTWKQPRPANTRQRLIWWKTGTPGMGDLRLPWGSADEEIYLLGKHWDTSVTPFKREGNIIHTKGARGGKYGDENKYGHPTPKPVPLMRHLIERCPPGTIADPFCGSGTTLQACRELGRKNIGVEINPQYCDATIRRITELQLIYA